MPKKAIDVVNPDLYDLCAQLKEKGADDNDIGKLYVSAVIAARKSSVASIDGTVSDDSKKDFQKNIRSNLGKVIFNINHQGATIESILENLHIRVQSINVGNSECVENPLYVLVTNGKYGLVGIAVVKGAQKYRQRMPRGMIGFYYKLDIEYDLIKREMETKLTEVWNGNKI